MARRSERIPIDEPARLHPNSWSSLEVRVLDVSRDGFKAECDARVTAGNCVTLEVPGIGAVYASVTWTKGRLFGAKFSQSIDLAKCGWSQLDSKTVLARLLVERAQARRSGLFAHELELRRKILAGLPILREPLER